jgi:hypothetical protein
VNQERRRAIVLVLDGLGAGFLGPYGNTWLDTPAMNRLASEGLLCEQAMIDSPDLLQLYQSLWTDSHAAFPAAVPQPSILSELTETGRHARLVTDEPLVAEHPLSEMFAQRDLLPLLDAKRMASDPDQTGLARLHATAISSWLDAAVDLMWVHGRAMKAAWDAPQDFREQFRDEDDPPIPSIVTPPHGPVPEGADPDELQGVVWAYAGQIALLDLCLDPFLDLWRQTPEPTLLILCGARGYALGEHGHWGNSAVRLHSERIQVPLIVAINDLRLARIRTQSLVQPGDVAATLRDWFAEPEVAMADRPPRSLVGLPPQQWHPDSVFSRPLAVTRDREEWAFRTPCWLACLQTSPGGDMTRGGGEMYVKPDDRWDVNNVEDRVEPVAEAFRALADRCRLLPAGQSLEDLLPLDPLLIEPPT